MASSRGREGEKGEGLRIRMLLDAGDRCGRALGRNWTPVAPLALLSLLLLVSVPTTADAAEGRDAQYISADFFAQLPEHLNPQTGGQRMRAARGPGSLAMRGLRVRAPCKRVTVGVRLAQACPTSP